MSVSQSQMNQDMYAFKAIDEICHALSQLPEPHFSGETCLVYYRLPYYDPHHHFKYYTKQLELVKKFEADAFLTKAIVNQKTETGMTPLIYLASKKFSFVHYIALNLINKGADVNEADNSGMTPCFAAAKQHNWILLMALLLCKKVKAPHRSPTEGPHKDKTLLSLALESFKKSGEDTYFFRSNTMLDIISLLLQSHEGLRTLGKLDINEWDPTLVYLVRQAATDLQKESSLAFRKLIGTYFPLSIDYSHNGSEHSLQFYDHLFNFTKKRASSFAYLAEIKDFFLFAAHKATRKNKAQIKKILFEESELTNPLLRNLFEALHTLKDTNSNSLLHLACQGGNIAFIEQLLPLIHLECRWDHNHTEQPVDEVIKTLFRFQSSTELYTSYPPILVQVNARNETALDIVALNITRLENEISALKLSTSIKQPKSKAHKKEPKSTIKRKKSNPDPNPSPDLVELELELKQQYKIRNLLMNVIQPHLDRFIFKLLQHFLFNLTGTSRDIIFWKIANFLGPFPGLRPGESLC